MDRAEYIDPAQAAADAVKAYVRLNRTRLSGDGELLAMLLPERFAEAEVEDLQRYTIERLVAQNSGLRAECDGLKTKRNLGDGVRRLILELLDARSFEDVIAIAVGTASAFGADRAGICIEGDTSGTISVGSERVRLIAPGLVSGILGADGTGVILASGGEVLLGPGGGECKSLAVFRLRLGAETPSAVFVLGARAAGCFEGEEVGAEIGFFARALERSVRAWLDLPKI
jgi:hypothetical protein